MNCRLLTTLTAALLCTACVPGTYYDPADRYVRGTRFFDRGQYDYAVVQWKTLAESGDCDAQYRYGTLFVLGAGVPRDNEAMRMWWLRAANQDQWRAQRGLAAAYGWRSIVTGSFQRQFQIDCTQGCGVERDNAEAYFWAKRAEVAASAESDRVRDGLRAEADQAKQAATPEQIIGVERRLAQWAPSPAACKMRRLL